ncbi:M14 family metallopeptidase [Nocardioides speluncae]|uniref:M14 family metallopeptidase n=1 Tax=Nocardioides speluncae TaxID=2670337 RepID=UPI000D68EE7F|nr:M14 family metallopeptidase [Nocardioides speluncae]
MPNVRARAGRWAVAAALVSLAAATAVAPNVGAQADPASVAKPEAVQILRVSTPSHVHKARLQALDLDLTEHGTRTTVDLVSYGRADRAKLRDAGFSWRVVVADLAEAERLRVEADKEYARAARPPGAGLPSGRTAYRTLADYGTDLASLAATYPSQTRLFNLNHPSLEGRQVKALEVSNNVAAKDGKPTFLVMGVHHAREWPSGELTIEFAYDLLKNSADPRIKNILDKSRVLFVPIVNPDGFDVSRTQTYEMKRKNCRITDLVLPGAGECQNSSNFSLGTDPNRNYGGFWGGPGASTSKTSETYRGSGAFSEPETQNIQELVSSRQVVTLITNHTYSNLVLRPPGYAAAGLTPDEAVYKALGDAMAAPMGYTSQYGYQLYDTTGTTEDWSYFATGGLGFTFEHGGNSFHPTFSNVVSMYKGGKKATGGAREAFLTAAESTVNETRHAVISGTAPAGVTLRLKKTFATATWSGATFQDTLDSTLVVPAGGSYTWHANPSTRPEVEQDGGTEAWTLTCESATGTVLETKQVTVDRGQSVTANLTC